MKDDSRSMVGTFSVFTIMTPTAWHVLLKLFFFFFFTSPRIKSYIPGMAFLLGFYQQHERNAKQEVSASVIAASADSIDVKIKFPEVLEETHYLHFYATLVLTAVFTWMCHFFCPVISIQSTTGLSQFHCRLSVFRSFNTTSQTQQYTALDAHKKTCELHKSSLIKLNWMFILIFPVFLNIVCVCGAAGLC